MQYDTILKEVIKEVKEKPRVEVSLFDWYGLDYDPFPIRPLNLQEIDKFFIDRDVEAKSLLKIILSSYERTGGKIVLVAPDGYGKTSFVNFIFHILEEYRSEIKKNLRETVKGGMWKFDELMRVYKDEDDEEYQGLDKFLDEIDKGTTFWAFDDCNDPQGVQTWISRLEKRRGNIVLILVFSAGNWTRMKIDFQDFTDSFKTVIYIGRMTQYLIRELIEKRLNGHDIFENQVIKKISERSDGVPWLAIYMARKCMIVGKQMMKKVIDESIMDKALDKTYDLNYMRVVIDRLSSKQKEVMLRLLQFDNGLSAEEMGDYLDVSRPTAVYHLRELYNKDLLTAQRKGRMIKYNIKVQFKIALESSLESSEG